jgi:hypothetical protein
VAQGSPQFLNFAQKQILLPLLLLWICPFPADGEAEYGWLTLDLVEVLLELLLEETSLLFSGERSGARDGARSGGELRHEASFQKSACLWGAGCDVWQRNVLLGRSRPLLVLGGDERPPHHCLHVALPVDLLLVQIVLQLREGHSGDVGGRDVVNEVR